MSFNKSLSLYYKLGNIRLEEGKRFTKNYNKQYDKRKNIAKDHFLLSNAFNITRLMKTNNKEFIPESFYFEENKSKDKLNIYNYKKSFENMTKGLKITQEEDDLLQSLLIKFDEKYIDDILKEREKILRLKSRILKGLPYKIDTLTNNNSTWKSLNKTNSLKSVTNFNNQSNYKRKDSFNFNNSSKLFKSIPLPKDINNQKDIQKRNLTLPRKYYTYTMNDKIKRIFKEINNKEKMAEKNSNKLNYVISINKNNYFRTLNNEKANFKSHSIKEIQIRRGNNLIKNIDKIRYRKDIENALFRQNEFLFSGIKNKLHSLYKNGKKIPQEYLDQ